MTAKKTPTGAKAQTKAKSSRPIATKKVGLVAKAPKEAKPTQEFKRAGPPTPRSLPNSIETRFIDPDPDPAQQDATATVEESYTGATVDAGSVVTGGGNSHSDESQSYGGYGGYGEIKQKQNRQDFTPESQDPKVNLGRALFWVVVAVIIGVAVYWAATGILGLN